MTDKVASDEVGERQFKVRVPCQRGGAVPAVEDPHQRPLPFALHAPLPRSAFGNWPAGSEAVSPTGS